jgi:predicted ATP-grasp superfamily ATP-dependent carboligase
MPDQFPAPAVETLGGKEVVSMAQHLLILGASTRAAAFSALRANLRPWCVDLFGDVDLRARCPARTIAPGDYPHGLVRVIGEAPPGPWIYTGAMENRPALIRQLARMRPLWGNDSPALLAARAPRTVQKLLRAAGLACPDIAFPGAVVPCHRRWLIKPRQGAGGKGIGYWTGPPSPQPSQQRIFYQEYIEGEGCAAIYVSDGTATRLLGVTRQLVGQSWLHTAAFHYCGSIGPLALSPSLREAFERLGMVLAHGCGLRGLFGIDCVLREGVPWPLEINPRYTASIEVLEYALGFSAVSWQRFVFERTTPEPRPASTDIPSPLIGKAILFAKAPLTFPAEGPWLGTLQSPGSVYEVPAFADIPPAGQQIAAGRPILTLFTRADSLEACLDSLKRTAADLDHWMFGG